MTTDNSIKPDLSVIIPCYNDGNFLRETLESTAAYKGKYKIEILVVNDGSNDQQTLDAFVELQPIFRFKLLNRPNGGLSAARNTGIAAAAADVFLTLDADDLIMQDFIDVGMKILEQDEKIGVVYGDCEFFGEKTGIRKASSDSYIQVFTNQLNSTALVRKSVWKANNGYDETMKLGYEDWEFWLHAMKNGWQFHHAGMISFRYRIRKASLSKTSVSHHKEILTYIQHKHHDFVIDNYMNMTRELHDIKNNRRRLLKYLFANLTGKVNR